MVNRRLLRTKAFQQLYAFYSQERAAHQMAFDHLQTVFQPDLSLMVAKEEQSPRLEGLRKLAEIQLQELFDGKTSEEEIPKEASEAAHFAYKSYQSKVKDIRQRIQKGLVIEIDALYRQYVKVLFFLQQLVPIAIWDENRRLLERPVKSSQLKLNKTLAILPKWKDLQALYEQYQVGWNEDEENRLKKVFIEGILQDQEVIDYLLHAGEDWTKDNEMVKYLIKNYLLKHPILLEYFEEKDLNWHLNKDVVKSLATKTFKVDAAEDLKIQDIALQWDEDRVYFETLFSQTLEQEAQLSQWIAEQTQHWESDRLAVSDFILLKMAITEMMAFPSIPVKVSINEFIELAKQYSTPKSGQFINGLLDVISLKLAASKHIQKSGRGLIDKAIS